MKSKSKKSLIWAALVLVSLSFWFALNLDQDSGRYKWHKKLWFANNNTFRKPVDLLTNYTHTFNKYQVYLNATNSIGRLYDQISIVNLLSAMPVDQTYRSREEAHQAGLPVSNVTSCGRQLASLKRALEKHPTYFELYGESGLELTNFMDAFGRPGPGVFSHGADAWLGSYEYCEKATISKLPNDVAQDDSHFIIKGHYCVGRYRFRSWSRGPSVNEPEPAIRMGLCLPEVCDSNSLEQFNTTIDFLAKQQLPELWRQQLILESLFCLPHSNSSIRQFNIYARIFLYLAASWLTLILVISVCYEYSWRKLIKLRHRKEQMSEKTSVEKSQSTDENDCSEECKKQIVSRKSNLMRFLLGLTLRNSIKSITIWRKPQDGARVNLCSLDFIKLMMALAIVASHSLIFSVYKVRTRQSYIDLGRSDMAKFILSFGRCVDTFLTIFGLTMSYTLLQRFDIRKLGNPFIWISANIAIFLRIWPLHALLILFNRWISPHLGSGPWWDYGTSPFSPRYECIVAPWYHIFPIMANHGKLPAPPCNPPAWFLGPYSQIALFIPFLTYLIGTLPNHLTRWLFVAICSLLSAANVAVRLYNQNVISPEAIGDYGGFAVAVVEKFESSGYMETLGRFGSVLIGAYAGYLLHLYQVGEITDWPSWFKSKFFQFCMLATHIALFLLPLLSNTTPKSPAEAQSSQLTMLQFALINLFMIPLWPVINCVLIVAAATVYNTHVVVRFMNHPVWSAANKLGLGIYLIHYEVLVWSLTFYDHAPSNGRPFEVLRLAGFACTTTIILAIFIYLCYEAPLAYIVSKFVIPALQRAGGGANRSRVRASIDSKLQAQAANDNTFSINMQLAHQDNPFISKRASRPNLQFISDNYYDAKLSHESKTNAADLDGNCTAAEEINRFLDHDKSNQLEARPQNGLLAKLNLG